MTTLVDPCGLPVNGATSAALACYRRALADFQSWRSGAEAGIDLALREAPRFVMAHVLKAWLFACSRDPLRIRSTREAFAGARGLPANERERGHLDALDAILADDLPGGLDRLGALLRAYPLDALALQAAHVFDYYLGNTGSLSNRPAAVLPSWSRETPGYHAVVAMHAFGLVENGEYDRGEAAARAALELEPLDARAHHVMAHVFEMRREPGEGIRWLRGHEAAWSRRTVVATHCWWHLALFHLALGEGRAALETYDDRVRGQRSGAIADLIDAAALLWRLELAGGIGGTRWHELAAAWVPHIDDAYCSFTDLHAMLAFVGARNFRSARRLERSLARAQSEPTRHAETTRVLGLPACRALIAYGRGDDALAIRLLAAVPAQAHRLGGSHAQRDVLHLTLQRAVERMRRPRSASAVVQGLRALLPHRGDTRHRSAPRPPWTTPTASPT